MIKNKLESRNVEYCHSNRFRVFFFEKSVKPDGNNYIKHIIIVQNESNFQRLDIFF